MLLALASGIGYAVLALSPRAPGLLEPVRQRLPDSGVHNAVTAVLLNFRGYDTLLEVSVLLLAVVGIWSLAEMPRRRVGPPGLVLEFLVQVLVPFMVLLGAYLVGAGSHAAGGAFQGGAVFAAALVLMLLAGAPLPAGLRGWPLRALLVLGLLSFVVTGLVTMASSGRFLELPVALAGRLILMIELAAAVSIGVILACALRGGRPEP
jgi:multisubunit Na+/H+ antiporter MnhB subunit